MSALKLLEQIVGATQVLTGEAMTPYLVDWRGRYRGDALAVVRPGSTEEVASVVRLCAEHKIPIVPSGGNTGLCGGATPDETGRALVVCLSRLNRVREIDTDNDTMTVEAGCVLQAVQEAAHAAGRLFPLSLAAEGSCTIGGNLATNAGGTQVLRYGNTRELALGLEVVTPQGEIWHGLRGLRKDNTGYDLHDDDKIERFIAANRRCLGMQCRQMRIEHRIRNTRGTSDDRIDLLDRQLAIQIERRLFILHQISGIEHAPKAIQRQCVDHRVITKGHGRRIDRTML